MSIADHAARFRPQLAFALEPPPHPPQPAAPLETPSTSALIQAALANEFVREFIAESVPTWSDAQVHRDPPCVLVYEHGEVVGSVRELTAMALHAEKRRGMGSVLGVRALRPDEEVLAYQIGLRWSATHPRRVRYERRLALRSLLRRGDRRAVTEAMRRNRGDFVDWARGRNGLATRVADTTGLSLEAFWREVRGRRRDAVSPPHTPSRENR